MDTITIILASATREGARATEVTLAAGTTAGQAADAASLMGVAPAKHSLSVWGKRVPGTHVLSDGDRLELCAPLAIDPKEGRRLRARRSAQEAESLRRNRGRRGDAAL